MGSTPQPSAAERPGPESGDRVGRYVVLRRLGAGGAGVVYAAYDPELNREVAVKLLRRERGASPLREEAQAMARLSHPNVLPVYDVGTDGGQVFVAMELLAGGT